MRDVLGGSIQYAIPIARAGDVSHHLPRYEPEAGGGLGLF